MTALSERLVEPTISSRDVAGHPSRALRYLPLTALTLDAALVTLAAVLAVLGRERLHLFPRPTDVSASLTVAGPLIVLGWLVVLAVLGGYRASLFGAGTDEFKSVANASLLTGGLVGVGCYLTKFDLPRGFFMLLFVIGAPAVLAGRLGLRRALQRARRSGVLQQRVVIAGLPDSIDEVAAIVTRESWLGFRVVGALTPPHFFAEATPSGIPVIGNVDDAVAGALEAKADVIFFARGSVTSGNTLREAVWDLEHADVQVVVAPAVTDVSRERVRVSPVGGLPLMHIDPPTAVRAGRWGKRLFDVVGSACLILAFSPVFVFSALRIKLHDHGPVLFKQTRIGKDGQEFTCLKFRTMVMDAEALIADLQDELGQTALLFKMKDDPRITGPGTWLRRFSIDELPQLFNVFRGDMSLVGPRPQVAREVALYQGPMIRRLRVRPGMTGLWQVSGRNDLTIDEAVRLDLYYVDNWSMIQDLTILWRTFGAVFGSRGAY